MAARNIAKRLVLMVAACGSVVLAQDRSAGTNTPHSLRMDVDLVLVNVTVTDKSGGRPVSGLPERFFRIQEDKVPQRIKTFSSEDVPVTVGILFDVSGSMSNKVANAIRAAQNFIRSGTRDDEYFMVKFSNSPVVVSDLSSDLTELESNLLSIRAKGNTALYDAVYLGLNMLRKSRNPKRALLLITDGEDNHSRYSFSQVRRYVREQDAEIYAIGILDPVTGAGRDALVELTKLTGGKAFFPYSSSELSEICKKISEELKNQYILGYQSTNRARNGNWRNIQVKVVDSQESPIGPVHVRARSGYFAPSGDTVLETKN
jgi:Ca-activated chloride channel family protein